jgi:preprotein translocase subunit SecD
VTSASARVLQRAGLSGLFLCCALLLTAWTTGCEAAPLSLEVASAAPAFDQRTGETIITIVFTPPSARGFAEFTTQNVGKTVEFRIDGRAVMKPVIREPILGGRCQISGSFTTEQAADIARRLSAGTAKLEIEVAE